MGIKRLLGFVKEAVDNIHIEEYRGKRVAIDTYCWIHKGSFACADKLAKGEPTDVYVKYCMKFINMLENFGITPVLVFDGCNLPAKELVEKDRRKRREENLAKGRRLLREGNLSGARDCFTKCVNVTSAMALAVMTAARNRGVDCIVAPYEADAQLAYLLKQALVDAVITEDSDLLCFGCKAVIFKLDLTGRCQRVEEKSLGRVPALNGFTHDQFRHICILSGCDYLPNVRGVGIAKAVKALKLSKGKNVFQVAKKLHQYVKGLEPVEASYAAEFERAEKTFLYQPVFDPVTRKLVPLNPYPDDSYSMEEMPFAGEVIPDDLAFQISLGNVETSRKRRVANFDVDCWLQGSKPLLRCRSIWKSGDQSNVISLEAGDCVKTPKKVECAFKLSGTPLSRKKSKESDSSKPPALVKSVKLSQETEEVNIFDMYKRENDSRPISQVVKSRFFSIFKSAAEANSKADAYDDEGSQDRDGDNNDHTETQDQSCEIVADSSNLGKALKRKHSSDRNEDNKRKKSEGDDLECGYQETPEEDVQGDENRIDLTQDEEDLVAQVADTSDTNTPSKNPFKKQSTTSQAEAGSEKKSVLNLFNPDSVDNGSTPPTTKKTPDSKNSTVKSLSGTSSVVKSKYFGRARPSGLKKSSKRHKKPFQASIRSFFDKV